MDTGLHWICQLLFDHLGSSTCLPFGAAGGCFAVSIVITSVTSRRPARARPRAVHCGTVYTHRRRAARRRAAAAAASWRRLPDRHATSRPPRTLLIAAPLRMRAATLSPAGTARPAGVLRVDEHALRERSASAPRLLVASMPHGGARTLIWHSIRLRRLDVVFRLGC